MSFMIFILTTIGVATALARNSSQSLINKILLSFVFQPTKRDKTNIKYANINYNIKAGSKPLSLLLHLVFKHTSFRFFQYHSKVTILASERQEHSLSSSSCPSFSFSKRTGQSWTAFSCVVPCSPLCCPRSFSSRPKQILLGSQTLLDSLAE